MDKYLKALKQNVCSICVDSNGNKFLIDDLMKFMFLEC